jgi:hypothetical protein
MRTEPPKPEETTVPQLRRAAGLSVAGVILTLALGGVAHAQYDNPPPPDAYVAGPTVYPETLPPDPIPEYRPPAPGYGFTWVNGLWDWTGYDWSWNNGYWIQARPGWAYFGPRFIWENGQPVYYRGFWQRPDGYREFAYGGGGMISPAWYARPRYEPRNWRADPGHSTAWRRAPGAPPGGWREAPRIERRREGMERREAVEHREGMEHREAEHREMEHREGVEHREAEHREAEHREMGHPGPGAGPGGMHPAGGPPPAHAAPAAHAGPPPAAAPQRGKKK